MEKGKGHVGSKFRGGGGVCFLQGLSRRGIKINGALTDLSVT